MSARRIHLFKIDSLGASIFDSQDRLVVDCLGGEVDEADARRMVASWNALSHLTTDQIEAIAEAVAELEAAA